MLKQLLTGSALALILAATPVAAQSDDATKQPEAQATEQAPEASTGASGSMETTTTAEGETLSTEESAEATSEEAIEAESDTAETDTMTTDQPAVAEGEVETEAEEMAEGEVTTDAGMTQASGELYIGQQAEGELLASDLMGSSVENPEGDKLGDINDVIVGESEGIKAVVIGVGGFLGIGEKDVAVNFDQIEQTRDENGDITLVLTTTKDDLENAPKFVSLEDQEEAQRQQAEAQQNQTMGGSGSMTGTGDANMGATTGTPDATQPAPEGQTQ